MMYESSTEFNLHRAIEIIKLAQQSYKRELEKKDEIIQGLQKRVEFSQFESEKENRELMAANQSLKHELSRDRMEKERLKDENSRLRMDLTAKEDKLTQLEEEIAHLEKEIAHQEKEIAHLEDKTLHLEDKTAHLEEEKNKANHIIRNLLKKFQVKPVPPKTV